MGQISYTAFESNVPVSSGFQFQWRSPKKVSWMNIFTFKLRLILVQIVFLKRDIMQLFSADATIFFYAFFLASKSWKNHPQKLLINTQHFFSPRQKNPFSKIWLIEELYIELGFQTRNFKIFLRSLLPMSRLRFGLKSKFVWSQFTARENFL